MKIVADNHADTLRRPGTAGCEAPLLDLIGCDLRALFGDAPADLPPALAALAKRLDEIDEPVALAA